jgi:hypothetical protein
MNDLDIGQSVRDVIASLEQKQAAIGGLVENLRIVFPGARIPVVEASAIAPSRPRRLLAAGKPGRKRDKRARRQRKGLAGVDVEALLARVTAQLKLGPCRVCDLASALRIDGRRTKLALYMMQRAGTVVVKGFSRGARWSLKGAPAVTPSPRQEPANSIVRHALRTKTLADAVHEKTTIDPPADSPGATGLRDEAILARLKKGPARFSDLQAALPKEPWLTDEQHMKACNNALTRLRLKKLIKQTEDGWALA